LRLTLHDVVSVSDETNADRSSDNTNLPERNLGLLLGGSASRPSSVHTSPDTNSVTNIVGTVSERSSAGSNDLDKRVQVLNLVGVLGGMLVDTLHTATLRCSLDTHLGSVDVVVSTVEESDNDLSGDTLDDGDQVVSLVDRSGTDGVGVKSSHGPAERSLALAEVRVVKLLSFLEHALVILLARLSKVEVSLLVVLGAGGSGGGDLIVADLFGVVLLGLNRADLKLRGVLDDSVVGNTSVLGIRGSGAVEQKRAPPAVPPAEGVVLLDDNGVDEGNEENGREEEETKADTKSHRGNVPSRLLSETKTGRSLVNDRQSTDGTSDEEEERRSPNSPRNGVLAHMNNILDQRKDNGGKATSDSGRHTKTSKDSTKTLATVPSPLNLASTNSSDTDTSER